MAKTQQITVRVPLDIINRLKKRGANSAPYIVEAVRDKLDRDEKAAIAASMLCLAEDPASNDISDLMAGQDRVIERGD